MKHFIVYGAFPIVLLGSAWHDSTQFRYQSVILHYKRVLSQYGSSETAYTHTHKHMEAMVYLLLGLWLYVTQNKRSCRQYEAKDNGRQWTSIPGMTLWPFSGWQVVDVSFSITSTHLESQHSKYQKYDRYEAFSLVEKWKRLVEQSSYSGKSPWLFGILISNSLRLKIFACIYPLCLCTLYLYVTPLFSQPLNTTAFNKTLTHSMCTFYRVD